MSFIKDNSSQISYLFLSIMLLRGCSCEEHITGDGGEDAEEEDDVLIDDTRFLPDVEFIPMCSPPSIEVHVKEGCGNGTKEEGEECDDGNILSSDGCSWDCRQEERGEGGDPGHPGYPGDRDFPLPLRDCALGDLTLLEAFDPDMWHFPGNGDYGENYWLYYHPLLVWKNDGYRLFYGNVQYSPEGLFQKLIAFNRHGMDVETLWETYLFPCLVGTLAQKSASGYDGLVVTDNCPFDFEAVISLRYQYIDDTGEQVFNESLGTNYYRSDAPLYLPCDRSEPIHYFHMWRPTMSFFNFHNRAFLGIGSCHEHYPYVELDLILTIERQGDALDLCATDVVNPIDFERATSFMEYAYGDGKSYVMLMDGDFNGMDSLFIATFSDDEPVSDIFLQPVCASPGLSRTHPFDLGPSENGFFAFAYCASQADDCAVPYVMQLDDRGVHAAPPAAFHYRDNPYAPCLQTFDFPVMWGAVGEDTLGIVLHNIKQTINAVFIEMSQDTMTAVDWCVLPFQMQSCEVSGLAWDGEMYSAIAMCSDPPDSPPGLYFWRFGET